MRAHTFVPVPLHVHAHLHATSGALGARLLVGVGTQDAHGVHGDDLSQAPGELGLLRFLAADHHKRNVGSVEERQRAFLRPALGAGHPGVRHATSIDDRRHVRLCVGSIVRGSEVLFGKVEAQCASLFHQATHAYVSEARQVHLLPSDGHGRFERRTSPFRRQPRNRLDRVCCGLGALGIESQRFGNPQGVLQVVQAPSQRHLRRAAPLSRVRVQQGRTRTSLQHRRHLPGEVVCVLDACIHPESAGWRKQMRGIAHQEHVRVGESAGDRAGHGPWTCVQHLHVGKGGLNARLDGLAGRGVVPSFQGLQARETRHLEHELASLEVVCDEHAHQGRVGHEVEHGWTRGQELLSQFGGGEVHVHQVLHAQVSFHGGAHLISHRGTCAIGAHEVRETSGVHHLAVRTSSHAHVHAGSIRFVSHHVGVESHVRTSTFLRASEQHRQESMLCEVRGRVFGQVALAVGAWWWFLRVWMLHHAEHVLSIHLPAVHEPPPEALGRRCASHACDERGIPRVQDLHGPGRHVVRPGMAREVLFPFEHHRGHPQLPQHGRKGQSHRSTARHRHARALHPRRNGARPGHCSDGPRMDRSWTAGIDGPRQGGPHHRSGEARGARGGRLGGVATPCGPATGEAGRGPTCEDRIRPVTCPPGAPSAPRPWCCHVALGQPGATWHAKAAGSAPGGRPSSEHRPPWPAEGSRHPDARRGVVRTERGTSSTIFFFVRRGRAWIRNARIGGPGTKGRKRTWTTNSR
eukprot:scaffold2696_cov333-Pavlova_lutheri.AAC.6